MNIIMDNKELNKMLSLDLFSSFNYELYLNKNIRRDLTSKIYVKFGFQLNDLNNQLKSIIHNEK